MAYAVQEGRTLLTHNSRDFIPLVTNYYFAERAHAGVILSDQMEKGELIRRTLALMQSVSADTMRSGVRFLADFK